MKKYYTSLFLLLLIAFHSSGQIAQSSFTSTDSIAISKYGYDAEQLALKYIYRNNLPEKDSIKIPNTISTRYFKALIAVFNATELTVRDSIIKLYDIRVLTTIPMNGVIIAANKNIDWMKKFALKTIPTGNVKIDSLVNAFGLKYYKYIRLTDFDGVYLETTHNYNIKSVNQLFLKIPGVIYSESFMVGKGNYATTISDSIFSDHIELTYSYGWGDCPSGCINRHYWVFNIYDDAKVEFVRGYGKNIPIASIFDSFNNLNTLKIYPNPTSGLVNIGLHQGDFWKNIQVVNAIGKVVMEEKYAATINLESLPAGVYTIRLYDQKGLQKQTKVVKK